MNGELPVTAVIINYKTPDLLNTAVVSLRRAYPRLPLLVIDNGADDESAAAIAGLAEDGVLVDRVIFNPVNLHHGPGMDQGAREVTTPYILFLDSDCEVLRGGFVEEMLSRLAEDPRNYAAGERVAMDRRGFDVALDTPGAIPYIRPVCMLLKREIYHTLPKFQLHGTPCLENMDEASRRGYGLIAYPALSYVSHAGRGTAERHGYGLGFRGKLNHLLHKIGL